MSHRLLAAIGTRVFRHEDGTVTIVPPELDWTPPEGLTEIHWVKDITIKFPLGEAITAEIELFPCFDVPVRSRPRYYVISADGTRKHVTAVEFEDGSRWEESGQLLKEQALAEAEKQKQRAVLDMMRSSGCVRPAAEKSK